MLWFGSVPVLATTDAVGFTLAAEQIRNTVGIRFPIPDDPGLEGLVLLWQYWFQLPGGGLAVSEVFGGRLLSRGVAAAAGRTRASSTEAAQLLRRRQGGSLRSSQETGRIRAAMGAAFGG